MTSFFGGDPNVAHYSADLPFLPSGYAADGLSRAERVRQKEVRDEQRKILKDAGFKEKYFQFRVNDAAGKQKAKRLCEEFAQEWQERTGVKLVVSEGAFL